MGSRWSSCSERQQKKTLKIGFFWLFSWIFEEKSKMQLLPQQIAILNEILVKYTFIMHRTHFPGYLRRRYHRGEEHMPYWKYQAGGLLSYVLNFFGNLSLGVLIKCVLIKKECILRVWSKFDWIMMARIWKRVSKS